MCVDEYKKGTDLFFDFDTVENKSVPLFHHKSKQILLICKVAHETKGWPAFDLCRVCAEFRVEENRPTLPVPVRFGKLPTHLGMESPM
jgi:hypothetical protein